MFATQVEATSEPTNIPIIDEEERFLERQYILIQPIHSQPNQAFELEIKRLSELYKPLALSN